MGGGSEWVVGVGKRVGGGCWKASGWWAWVGRLWVTGGGVRITGARDDI